MLPNVNVIKKWLKPLKLMSRLTSQPCIDFLIGLYGIAGSDPVAVAVEVKWYGN